MGDTANEMTVCVYEAHASKLFAVWIDLQRWWIGDEGVDKRRYLVSIL